MKKSEIIQIIREEIVNEEISLPDGYFQVLKSFKISPGGGWTITFRKDSLLKYNNRTKQLSRWNPIDGEWKNVAPPISGVKTLDIARYGRGYDQSEMLASFNQGTRKISPKDANKLMQSIDKEIIVLVKDVVKTINKLNLSPKQKIKITII